jgi:preprotein translocase SecE subunit
VARDRQRAKQRRKRQAGAGGPSPSRNSARSRAAREVGLEDAKVEDAGLGGNTPTPGPLDHASADVDEARLAEAGAIPPPVGDDDDFDDLERAPDEVERDLVPDREIDPALAEERAEARRSAKPRGRAFTFLRHCVDELRRVQWPNRRQVGQATAVVLGFVVLAGGYLGLMDALWKPIIDAIL